jgi:hypothetical protein
MLTRQLLARPLRKAVHQSRSQSAQLRYLAMVLQLESSVLFDGDEDT